MNIYSYRFTAKCPSNNRIAEYHLTIETQHFILAESIIKECGKLKTGYHEQIADRLHDAFGGKQTITAYHHGVHIETRRG